MENEEHQFTKGFNSGYLMSKYEPELLNKITSGTEPKNIYMEGLFSGKEQHEKELRYPTPIQTKDDAITQKNKDFKNIDKDHE